MTDTKHTPGPWFMGNVYPQRESAPGCDVGAESGENICLVHFDEYDTSKRVCTANASLIAAAPELLEYALLEEEISRAGLFFAGADLIKRAHEVRDIAIAKAKGEDK